MPKYEVIVQPAFVVTEHETLTECRGYLLRALDVFAAKKDAILCEFEFTITLTKKDHRRYSFGACGPTAIYILRKEPVFLRETKNIRGW